MLDARAVQRQNEINAKNRKSRAEGKAFEAMIEAGCLHYKAIGKASVAKVPEARQVIGRTGGRSSQMICVNAKKAHPDFMGSLAPDGHAIVFEAKHTDKDRLLFTAVTEHQDELLQEHLRMGASCYVMVSFGFKDYFRVPYHAWLAMKEIFGRKYIKPDDEALAQWRMPCDGEVCYFLDSAG